MNQYLLMNACRTLLCCFVLFHTTDTTNAQNRKASVLFVGDNYTYTNNLPQIVANMAASTGDTLEYDMSAQTDLSFWDHVGITTLPTIKKLQAGGWDYVVLQERSWSSAFPDGDHFHSSLYYQYSFTYAKQLVDSVRRYNPCAKLIFYMTWGRKNGLPDACRMYGGWPYYWPWYCTYQPMDSLIRVRTIDQAHFNKAAVAPVGAVWRYIRDLHPGIELYQPNGSDPSLAGSYAGACSMYTAIFKKSAEGITFNASLPAEVAANIRTVAGKCVYDSLQFWRIDKYETKAGFSHQALRMQMISFTNQSVKASQYKWDFGDGQSSAAINPTHAYVVPGAYTVRLIATGNSCSDTTYASINIADDPDAGKFIIAPNPATDKLYITSNLFGRDQYRLQLLNSMGQLVLEQQTSDAATQSINVAGLTSGIYTLSICTTKSSYLKKVIIQ